ncbi:NADPH-dependent 7-cyano-7-deazaguanine reductase QueF [Spongiibacter taiwanensis]|uniref:NADPH-dependent 7-cyano-7-deazaguanine reductase QueF n=1 Tax=Spongiibacter taiwanensis TaxID=1748242 RepID=UPI0020359F3A|nr:NADPH-dependent 7-cyano-7-deazaguanine reductase QueF [Spongiibacter taiwanensis]USA43304.1 NADPH-dependent 7-cyano-7-deazaguanine reductase QueF [Spongiibacter taiwanensis]
MSGVKHGPLGESVNYPTEYSADLLHPIPRAPGRDALALTAPIHGSDVWTAFELSWLNASGKPMVACAEFFIPAASSHIIESKSFKLYLNSLNQHRLGHPDDLVALLKADLSARVGCAIDLRLYLPDDWHSLLPVAAPPGLCLDALEVHPQNYELGDSPLKSTGKNSVAECLYSNLLRSRCPVTGQPDWATVIIDYCGPQLSHEALLLYLISFRQHDDFHEHCVERIYRDIWRDCEPERLTVSARYLRRGGLDINPWRSSDPQACGAMARLVRQ